MDKLQAIVITLCPHPSSYKKGIRRVLIHKYLLEAFKLTVNTERDSYIIWIHKGERQKFLHLLRYLRKLGYLKSANTFLGGPTPLTYEKVRYVVKYT